MAITKIIKVKANPKACIKYVTNPNKTNDKLLVSCVVIQQIIWRRFCQFIWRQIQVLIV